MYDSIFVYFILFIIGACFGSFAGATVWRVRARQLKEDKKEGEHINRKEYAKLEKLTRQNLSQDRSRCLNCDYTLRWYDLVPIISWLSLGGKCRQCYKPIGYMEPIIEIGTAAFFVISYIFWPGGLHTLFDFAQFVIWLIAGVTMAVLFVYDLKWFLLPDKFNFTLTFIGIINAILVLVNGANITSTLLNILMSTIVLSGIYYVLYIISKGAWIGFGDVKLGLGFALLLVDWKLALLALFTANLIGCVVVIPGLITGRLKKDSRVPFGPFLMVGFFIAKLFGYAILSKLFSSLI